MKPKNRDQVLADFYADEQRSALVAAAESLTQSYAAATAAARENLGAEPYWALITQDERDDAAKAGQAMPDGSYPVRNVDELDKAIGAVGRGGADHDAIRRHIMKRADALDAKSHIPDNWNADGSLKDDASASGARLASLLAASLSAEQLRSLFEVLADDAPAADPPPAVPGASKPPAEPPAATAPTKAPGEDKIDAQVSVELQNIKASIGRALKAQQGDPGISSDPADAKVLAGLELLSKAIDGIIGHQDDDSSEPPAPAATPAAPKAPPAAAGSRTMPFAEGSTPGNAVGVPGDADDSPPQPGDIEPSELCQNPNCGHMASSHMDTQDGDNTGHCQMQGCECPGMVPEGDQIIEPDGAPTDEPDTGDGDGGDAPADGGAPPAVAAAAYDDGAPPAEPATPDAPEPDAPDAPPVGGPSGGGQLPPLNPEPNVAVGPQFTVPVAALEGIPTGDGRIIEPDALTWRTPPLALMGLDTSAHDPSGMSGNDPAELVGRIESVTRDGSTITATGHMLNTIEGMKFAEKIEQMGRMGISIDVGAAEVQITAEPTIVSDPGDVVDVFDAPMLEHLVAGEIMGMTVCPFPAFAGAYIVLGDGSDLPKEAMPAPTPEQAAMGIRFVGEVPCVPCQQDGSEPTLVAAAGRPTLLRPPSGWFTDPGFNRGDPRLRETIDTKTGKPSGKFACPITVTDDGQVFGHIAQWEVCHQNPSFIGSGQCVLPPRTRCGYTAFHGTGEVLTAEGEMIGVGRMTADTGHAPQTGGVSFARAVAHYDNSGLTAALVRAGEDEFGIWVAGALHPSTSEEQVYTMRSNPPSGDWRPFGAGRELCNVLFVNNPGFPMVKATQNPSTGQITSLVAAGVPLFSMPAPVVLTADERLARIERTMSPVLGLAWDHLRGRAEALRGR